MLATILGVLGRSNQPALAQEIFSRAEPELGNCVQVRRSSCVVVVVVFFSSSQNSLPDATNLFFF
jgi:hypothetical protein